MKVIYAPNHYEVTPNEIPCFMAGGLQRCNWHYEFLDELDKYQANHLVIYNPRRDDYGTFTYEKEIEQITWEFTYLNKYIDKPYIFSMYFDDSESPQPICFYELGRSLALLNKDTDSLVISVNPNFSRKNDVIIQTSLANKKVKVEECSSAQHAKRVVSEYSYILAQMK